ncbi:MAG: glutamate 5-kinase [Elusimicrobia bacterium]|jgi:glutamate 5-kinase|nr:glutamate 5-kinase [Elusimicrobiota bacterium]MBK7207329.1 glutamate 5-kinase [Elusimicrobiota bacterium]MBK7546142.1 glutamate 5-kinase [Elusimicrobiota bacterium]MBK7575490.1 glutamate 5-kinase [Elusimicrobiota bacterium]MBK7689200.1 glutamate 5-kinase [Elusimicrobiota bacterium]
MKPIVVKVGTAVISRPEGGLNASRIRALADELGGLAKKGLRPILVTSGAIGAGMDAFGWKTRPTVLKDKQAAAAVGQPVLMEAYKAAFAPLGVAVAQVLLTRADLDDRERYLNIRNTLGALLERGVVPIINENDTVATQEIKFGDNDTLSALVAARMDAARLFILTDVDGLLTSTGADGQLLPEIFQITPDIEALVQAGTGSAKSVGGMASKLSAARLAMASGVEVWIASGRRPGMVRDILEGKGVGTRFVASPEALSARKRWIAFGRKLRGAFHLDEGAARAVTEGKRSLLPSGVVRVEGAFDPGDTVRLVAPDGREIARGLTAFGAADVRKIKGHRSQEIENLLNRAAPAELIHRNNLVVL